MGWFSRWLAGGLCVGRWVVWSASWLKLVGPSWLEAAGLILHCCCQLLALELLLFPRQRPASLHPGLPVDSHAVRQGWAAHGQPGCPRLKALLEQACFVRPVAQPSSLPCCPKHCLLLTILPDHLQVHAEGDLDDLPHPTLVPGLHSLCPGLQPHQLPQPVLALCCSCFGLTGQTHVCDLAEGCAPCWHACLDDL